MGFVVEGFFDDGMPCIDVCAYIVEFCAVNAQVDGWFWWSVEDGVEVYVSAQAMREEEASYDAFIDDVESSCVVQISPVCVGSAYA